MAAATVSGQVYPPVTLLQPGREIQIPAPAGFRLRQVKVSDGMLHFFGQVSRNETLLISTDDQGRLQATAKLPSKATEIFAGRGLMIALVNQGGVRSLVRVDVTDGVHETTPLRAPVDHLAVAAGKIVGWSEGRFFSQPADSDYAVAAGVASAAFAVNLPPDRIAVVDSSLPKLRILDARGVLLSEFPLKAPEITAPPAGPDPGVKRLTVFDVTSDEDGNLYCLISPYRPRDGAIILEFNTRGELLRRFRAVLPAVSVNQGGNSGTGFAYLPSVALFKRDLWLCGSRRCIAYPVREWPLRKTKHGQLGALLLLPHRMHESGINDDLVFE